MGQVEWEDSQRSMHLQWNRWPQGSVRSSSPSSYPSRHTVHSTCAPPVVASPFTAASASPLR